VGEVVTSDFRVGAWLVKPSLDIISRNGATVRLEPKVMGVLVCLAGHAGEALPKETLLQTVWPDTFVSEDVLKRCISELRRVFEDDAREPRIIETIPKRGYRLVASTDAAAPSAPNIPAARVARDSIAVLPFVNMSADPENEFFADGITEEIINALAQIKDLHVVARSSAFLFKGKHIDVRVVGERLSVRTVLEGSVRRVGNHLRITAQLVNAADGYHLWSERYDREMKDVFEIQDEIAHSIAQRLEVAFAGAGPEPLVRAGTKNLEAYQLYLKGRALLDRRGAMISQALQCLEQAVAIDPEYALAWAAIADVYTLLGFYGFAHPEASRCKWQQAARRALAADASLAEAHSASAFGNLMYDWNHVEAEREFLYALELNPRNVQAREWYAMFYLGRSGRLTEAVGHAKLALEADPLSCYANSILGLIYGFAGRHADAVQNCERAGRLDSESFLARWSLQAVLYFGGSFDEAIAAGQRALDISGRHPWAMAILALTLAGLKKVGDAEAVYIEMSARARREYVLPSALALAAAGADRRDRALQHASEAIAIHDPFRAAFSSHYAFSARLRADPGIDRMLNECGID
jgi:adenylate cyclase